MKFYDIPMISLNGSNSTLWAETNLYHKKDGPNTRVYILNCKTIEAAESLFYAIASLSTSPAIHSTKQDSELMQSKKLVEENPDYYLEQKGQYLRASRILLEEKCQANFNHSTKSDDEAIQEQTSPQNESKLEIDDNDEPTKEKANTQNGSRYSNYKDFLGAEKHWKHWPKKARQGQVPIIDGYYFDNLFYVYAKNHLIFWWSSYQKQILSTYGLTKRQAKNIHQCILQAAIKKGMTNHTEIFINNELLIASRNYLIQLYGEPKKVTFQPGEKFYDVDLKNRSTLIELFYQSIQKNQQQAIATHHTIPLPPPNAMTTTFQKKPRKRLHQDPIVAAGGPTKRQKQPNGTDYLNNKRGFFKKNILPTVLLKLHALSTNPLLIPNQSDASQSLPVLPATSASSRTKQLLSDMCHTLFSQTTPSPLNLNLVEELDDQLRSIRELWSYTKQTNTARNSDIAVINSEKNPPTSRSFSDPSKNKLT